MSPKAVLILSVVTLLAVSNAFVAWKSYGLGADHVQGLWNKEKADAAEAAENAARETVKKNKAVQKVKKDAKHEANNFDRDTIIRNLCAAGWMREPSINCK